MEIINLNRVNNIKFSSINTGECFMRGCDIYIKTGYIEKSNGKTMNAVNLKNGSDHFFLSNEQVKSIEITLLYKEKMSSFEITLKEEEVDENE